MTELNFAYEGMNNQYEQFSQPEMPSPPIVQQVPKQQLPPTPPPQMPPQQHQQQQEGFQNNYQQQGRRYPEYSFWDRMVMSKREVLKLFILSIVIILGISLEKLGYHYITSYISSTDLTTLQEFMVRLSFPVIVFLFLWIIKSL